MKGCAPDTLPSGAKSGKCKDDVSVDGKKGKYCVCDGDDLCNGADANNAVAALVVFVALAFNVIYQ